MSTAEPDLSVSCLQGEGFDEVAMPLGEQIGSLVAPELLQNGLIEWQPPPP